MEVMFYEKENGSMPAKDFIDSCMDKEQVRIDKTINLLKEVGHNLSRPYAAPLVAGINELRINGVDRKIRILYFYIVGNKAIITNGFVKKTQAVSKKEIVLAIKYREDYKRRMDDDF